MSAEPIAKGDLVKFHTGEQQWRVTALSLGGDRADLVEWPMPKWSRAKRRGRVDTRRLVRLGR